MAAESQALIADEAVSIVGDIKRLSGGGDSVTFGVLMEDEEIEQKYEALIGTLKAARKKGLIAFEGEMLLKGQQDNVVISVTAGGGEAPAPAPATAAVESTEAPAAAEAPAEEAPVAPSAAEEPVAAEAPVVRPVAASDATEDARGQSKDTNGQPPSWKVDTSYINYRTQDPNRLEAKGDRTAGLEGAPQMPSAAPITSADKQKDEDGKWKKVDTGYIEHRTHDPNRFEARKSVAESAEGQLPVVGTITAADKQKDEDGKWKKVDTGYIEHRTHDPERFEARKAQTSDAGDGPIVPGTTVPVAQKDESGKWKSVDVSYINHRTADCDRLDGRARTASRVSVGGDVSATVRKEGEGKWKVDTSYIGYRTADTNNLDRKTEEANSGPQYASPQEKKYSYAELKLPTGERPADIDPAMKEQYLSAEEFQAVFAMSAADFAKLPKWKQQNMKKAKELW